MSDSARRQGSVEPMVRSSRLQLIRKTVLAAATFAGLTTIAIVVLRPPPKSTLREAPAIGIPDGNLELTGDVTTDALTESYRVSTHPYPVHGGYRPDFAGTHINITDGVRHSYVPADPQLTVWFFGGSTMFGLGQRDEHTIPSEFARLAEADGIAIEAVNLGVSGHTNWGATEVFSHALTSGPPPNVAVFYDGTNEYTTSSFYREISAKLDGRIARQPISDADRTQFARVFDDQIEVDEELLIDRAAEQYRRGVVLGRAMASGYGTEAVHFWQPQITSKQIADHDEAALRFFVESFISNPDATSANDRAIDLLDELQEVYDQMRIRSGVDPIDISDALDEATGPTLFDWSHTNEYGALLVAEAMYQHLRPTLLHIADNR